MNHISFHKIYNFFYFFSLAFTGVIVFNYYAQIIMWIVPLFFLLSLTITYLFLKLDLKYPGDEYISVRFKKSDFENIAQKVQTMETEEKDIIQKEVYQKENIEEFKRDWKIDKIKEEYKKDKYKRSFFFFSPKQRFKNPFHYFFGILFSFLMTHYIFLHQLDNYIRFYGPFIGYLVLVLEIAFAFFIGFGVISGIFTMMTNIICSFNGEKSYHY